MTLTNEDVRQILSIIEASSFDSIEIRIGDMSLAASKSGPLVAQQAAPPVLASAPQPAAVGQPSTLPSSTQDVATRRVMMRSDESLAAFASRNGVSEQDLLRLNGLTSASQVRPGQVLVVPVVSSQPSVAKSASQSQGLPPASVRWASIQLAFSTLRAALWTNCGSSVSLR